MKVYMSSLLLLCCLLTSCFVFKDQEKVVDENNLKSVRFSIPVEQGSQFSKVADSAIVKVIKDDVVLFEQDLEISETGLTGLVNEIPAGTTYLFVISVFDTQKDKVYEGSTEAEMLAGKIVEVNIEIKALKGSALINGTIVEDVVVDSVPCLEMDLHSNVLDKSKNPASCTNYDVSFGTNSTENGAIFDGATSYVSVEKSDLLNIGDKSFSVAFWLKAPIQDAPIVSKYRGGIGSPEQGWNIQCENNEHGTGVRFDLSDGQNGKTGLLSSGLTALDNQWHHFVVIVDRGSEKSSMFMDGKLVDEVNISHIGSAKTLQNLILGWRGDYWVHLKGVIKNLYIFNSAITTATIETLSNGDSVGGMPSIVLSMPLESDVKDIGSQALTTEPTGISFSDAIAYECAVFNGKTSYISIEKDELLSIGKESFSVVFDLKAPIQDAPILSKYRGGVGTPETGWSIQCENNLYGTGVRFDISDGQNGQTGLIATGIQATDESWHNVCIIVDKQAKLAGIYLDGVLKDRANISTLGSAANNDNILVGWRGDYWNHYNGSLKNLKIYSYAITTEELLSHQ